MKKWKEKQNRRNELEELTEEAEKALKGVCRMELSDFSDILNIDEDKAKLVLRRLRREGEHFYIDNSQVIVNIHKSTMKELDQVVNRYKRAYKAFGKRYLELRKIQEGRKEGYLKQRAG